jgi:two-component system, NtrC family, response regulator HydG
VKTSWRILVVDDDERWRKALSGLLANPAYCIVECDGEEQALKAIALQYFDLLLLDYRLGDGDGLSIMRRAHEMSLLMGAIIVVTGFPDSSVAVTAMELGAVDFFNKGDLKDLRTRVQHALARQSDVSHTR